MIYGYTRCLYSAQGRYFLVDHCSKFRYLTAEHSMRSVIRWNLRPFSHDHTLMYLSTLFTLFAISFCHSPAPILSSLPLNHRRMIEELQDVSVFATEASYGRNCPAPHVVPQDFEGVCGQPELRVPCVRGCVETSLRSLSRSVGVPAILLEGSDLLRASPPGCMALP